jgi:transposase
LQPTRRRPWAPRGQTPIHKCWDRHDRLSVGGALTCPPQRKRLGFYCRLHSHNIRTSALLAFLHLLHRQVRRPLLLVLDRWSVHRAAVARLVAQRPPWLVAVSWLPAYAPELNPVEQIWNHTKYRELANYLPADVEALHDAVGLSLASTRFQQTLLRSCFAYAKLKL